MYKLRKMALLMMGLFLLTGCSSVQNMKRFDAQYLDLFDTVTSVTGYVRDEAEFDAYSQVFYEELKEYHQLYDIYHNYEGINNIKTINDNAGIKPVKVDNRIINLLQEAAEMEQETHGAMNIAMGSVLSYWHDARTAGLENPRHARIPDMDLLREAARHTDLNSVVINVQDSTVYLPDAAMSLDVGSIGKGYATEMVCQKLEADGLTHALISVGGNVRTIGDKGDGSAWKVGIQNPDTESASKYRYVVNLQDQSLVTSGSYQRYYEVEGVRYHHIINPKLLMPWNEYASVSILCKDSGIADALSTAVFNMSLEEGQALIEGMEDVEALWIRPDGSEVFSSGFKKYLAK